MKKILLFAFSLFSCVTLLQAQAQVSFFNASVVVNEANREAQVTLTSTAAGAKGVIQVTAGNATNGQDYEFPPSYLFEFLNTTPQTVTIPIILDDITEGEETFTLTIVPDPSTNASPNTNCIVRIQDANIPVTRFEKTEESLEEQSVTRTFQVFRKNITANTSQVEVKDLLTGTAAPGTDYFFKDTVLTFAPNDSVATLSYQVIEDIVQEVNQTIVLQIKPVLNVDTADGQGTFVITIIDDDKPSISFEEPVLRIAEGDTQNINLILDAPAFYVISGELQVVAAKTTTSIDFDNGGGSAIPFGTKNFSIPIGDTIVSVPLYTFNDVLIEGQENLVLKFGNLVNVDEQTPNQEVLINIADNDKVMLEFSSPTGNHLEDEGAVFGQFNVYPETSPALAPGEFATVKKEVNFSISKIGGTATEGIVGDYYLFPKSFTIPAEFQVGSTPPASIQYQFSFLDDNKTECDETFKVGIKLPTPAEFFPIDTIPFNGTIDGTILDNDSTRITFSADTITFNEADGAQTVNIFAKNPNVYEDVDVEVNLIPGGAASQGVDFQLLYPQYYSFKKNDATPQTMDLSIVEDLLVENTEYFLVVAKVTSPAFTCPRIVQQDTTAFGIVDNDSSVITITNDSYNVSETPNPDGFGGTVPNSYFLELRVTQAFQNPVDVQLNFTDQSATYGFNPAVIGPDHGDYYVEDNTNTPIPAGNLPVVVTIPAYATYYVTEIFITDDILQENNHDFDVTISRPIGSQDNWTPGAQDSIRITIIDDDPIISFEFDSTMTPENIGDYPLNVVVSGNTRDDLIFAEILVNIPNVGTATDSIDFIAKDTIAPDTILLVIPAGSGNKFPTLIEIIDDIIVDPAETIFFTLTNAGIGQTELDVYKADRFNFISNTPNLIDTLRDSLMLVIDDNDVSQVYFDTIFGDTLDILESTVQTQITLLSNDPNLPGCGGSIRIIQGTASPNTDYVAVQMPFLFTGGTSSIPDPIVIVNDQQPEVPEFFGLYLHSADVGTGCPIGERDTLWIRILDDDRGDTLRFQRSTRLALETDPQAKFNLVNDSNTVIDCAVRVTIDQAKSSATAMQDIQFTSAIFDFADVADTIVQVAINLIDDLAFEGDEVVVFYLEDIGIEGCPVDPKDTLYFTIKDNEIAYGLEPISAIRPVDPSTGIATRLGDKVDITGIVHGLDYSGDATNLNFYVQDATGGVNVRTVSGSYLYTPAEGDSLVLGGTVRQIHGLTYLEIERLNKIAANKPLYAPQDIEQITEEDEGKLVRLYCQGVVNESQWNAQGAFYDVQVKSPSGINTIRIPKNSTFYGAGPQPGKLSIVGIASQQDLNEPLQNGYVLLARYKTDLKSVNRADFDFAVAGPQVSFTNNSYLSIQQFWNFGDNLGTSDLLSPTYSYKSTGNYTVTLTTENARGCEDQTTRNVSIETLTGIDGIAVSVVRVFPNPSSGKFTLQTEGVIARIQLIAADGKLLPGDVATLHQNQALIDISAFASGAYSCKIEMQDGSIGNVPLIKE